MPKNNSNPLPVRDEPGIYMISCLISEKVYIGSAQSLKIRYSSHFNALKRKAHQNKHLQSAYNLYGEDQFVFSPIEYCQVDCLTTREQYWTDYFKSYNNKFGYNQRPIVDSNRGVRFCEQARRSFSEGAKKRLQRPEELERLRRQAVLVSQSDAIKAKISKSRTGIGHTEEAKARIAASLKGRAHTPEAIERMRKSQQKAFQDPIRKAQILEASKKAVEMRVGKEVSKETRSKMSISSRARVNTPGAKVGKNQTLLSEEYVLDLRLRAPTGGVIRWLKQEGAKIGVSYRALYLALVGRSWKHLPGARQTRSRGFNGW